MCLPCLPSLPTLSLQVTFGNAVIGTGTHRVTMASLSTAAAAVAEVASVAPAADLVHGAYYFMILKYTPAAGGADVQAQAFVVFDAVTQGPTLTSPGAGSTASAAFEIDFTLPENALTGTVTVTIVAADKGADPAPDRVITFGTAAEDVGRTRVDADGENLAALAASAPEVASVAPNDATANLIHDQRYSIEVSYQDYLGNEPAKATSANVLFDAFAAAIVVIRPASGDTVPFRLPLEFTLPERAQEDGVRLSLIYSSGSADPEPSREVTFGGGFEEAGTHTVEVGSLLDRSSADPDVTITEGGGTDLVDGAHYVLSFGTFSPSSLLLLVSCAIAAFFCLLHPPPSFC